MLKYSRYVLSGLLLSIKTLETGIIIPFQVTDGCCLGKRLHLIKIFLVGAYTLYKPVWGSCPNPCKCPDASSHGVL